MADQILTAEVNNYIGQKLFAYIHEGTQINDRIKQKFAKSLIFIGDEGQIYNPLTNTYIGIGKTAYTNTLAYVADAHNKIDALNTALTSSLVSGIYANWSEKEWEDLIASRENDGGNWNKADLGNQSITNVSELGKIFATNDIVIKGKGDYDPETKLASHYTYSHIYDENYAPDSKQNKFYTYSSYTEKHAGDPIYATSGITVSLNKGKNLYLYVEIEPISYEPGGEEDDTIYNKYVFKEGSDYQHYIESWVNDIEDLPRTYDLVVDGETKHCMLRYDSADGKQDINSNALPVFKQGGNVLTIDDEQTWSYIASAYSYTMAFAKNYTNSEINRIYSEILGWTEPHLIPVAYEQAYALVHNGSAVIDGEGDLGNTFKYELDRDSVFLRRINLQDGTWGKIEFKENGDIDCYPEGKGTTSYVAYAFPEFAYLRYDVSYDEDTETYTYTLKYYPNNGTTGITVDGSMYFQDKDTVNDRDGFTVTGEYVTDGNDKNFSSTSKAPKDYYNSSYVYTPITDLSDIKDGSLIYVVNKNAINNTGINLADGINTFKEVAYILDAITNGLNGDSEDGITLAYSIAYNHAWNEAQDKRLDELEGGTNVVSSLRTDKNNKYVTTYLTSSIYYQIKDDWKPFDISGVSLSSNPLETDKHDLYNPNQEWWIRITTDDATVTDKTTYIRVLPSVIDEFNTAYYHYWLDSTRSHADGEEKVAEPNIVSYITKANIIPEKYYASASDGIYLFNPTYDKTGDGSYSYVGHVSLGIDLDLATTYTAHDFEDDKGGYSVADYTELEYTTVINVKLPQYKTPTVLVPENDDIIIDNKYYNLFEDDCEGTGFSDHIFSKNGVTSGLSYDDETYIKNLISNYNLLPEGTAVTDATLSEYGITINYLVTDEVNSIEASVKITIVGTDKNKVKYDNEVYVKTGEDTYRKLDKNNPEDAKLLTIDFNDIPYYRFYRREKTSVKNVHASLTNSGLVDVDWITAFMRDQVTAFTDTIKDYEFNAYIYTNKAIDRLDSEYTAQDSKYIFGLKQTNGIVTGVEKELPSDKIISDFEIWGETSNEKVYEQIEDLVSGGYYKDITHDEPIYVLSDTQKTYKKIVSSASNKVGTIAAGTPGLENSDSVLEPLYIFDTEENAFVEFKESGQNSKYKNAYLKAYNSLVYGINYQEYVQLYTASNAYVMIDPADMIVNGTSVSYTLAGDSNQTKTAFYKVVTNDEKKEIKYLSTESGHHDYMMGGEGGNTLSVTAHITKLIDATADNSGLVDAYDVRNTLDNLFEWVDISEWSDTKQNILNKVGGDDELESEQIAKGNKTKGNNTWSQEKGIELKASAPTTPSTPSDDNNNDD